MHLTESCNSGLQWRLLALKEGKVFLRGLRLLKTEEQVDVVLRELARTRITLLERKLVLDRHGCCRCLGLHLYFQATSPQHKSVDASQVVAQDLLGCLLTGG